MATKTDRLLKTFKPVKLNVHRGRMVLPNNSGDHTRSIKRNNPINSKDLVNKKYVDDNIALPENISYDGTTWNGNMNTTTKNTIRDKIASMEYVIGLNTTHKDSDGSDHADVATNSAKISYTDAAAVALNTTHRSSNGSDHSKVTANETSIGTNTTGIGLNTTHRGSNGTDHSDVVANNAKVTYDDAAIVAANAAHVVGDGSDHTDVATNNAKISYTDAADVALNTADRHAPGSDNQVSSDFTHNDLTGVDANDHLDWTQDLGATNIHAGNYTDTNTQLSDGEVGAYGYTKDVEVDWTASQAPAVIHADNYTDTDNDTTAHASFSQLDYASAGHTGFEPAKGADDNFVTDAEKVVIGNTSGTNTGDQNSHDALDDVSADDHHAQSHNVASHSDTTATGTELDSLTNGSIITNLHRHSRLVRTLDSTSAVLSNNEGIISMVYQSRISAGNSAAQSIPNAAYTTLVYNTEHYDSQGEFVPATGIFTATVAGYYQVNWQCLSVSVAWTAGKIWAAMLSKNNSTSSGSLFTGHRWIANAAFSGIASSGGSAIVYLAVNDTLRIKLYQNQGGAVNTAATQINNYLMIHKLS